MGQIYSVQRWEKDFGPVKERLQSGLPWVRCLHPFGALVRICFGKILKSILNIYKIDVNSKVIFKGLFARVCIEVDIIKPLQMKI